MYYILSATVLANTLVMFLMCSRIRDLWHFHAMYRLSIPKVPEFDEPPKVEAPLGEV